MLRDLGRLTNRRRAGEAYRMLGGNGGGLVHRLVEGAPGREPHVLQNSPEPASPPEVRSLGNTSRKLRRCDPDRGPGHSTVQRLLLPFFRSPLSHCDAVLVSSVRDVDALFGRGLAAGCLDDLFSSACGDSHHWASFGAGPHSRAQHAVNGPGIRCSRSLVQFFSNRHHHAGGLAEAIQRLPRCPSFTFGVGVHSCRRLCLRGLGDAPRPSEKEFGAFRASGSVRPGTPGAPGAHSEALGDEAVRH
mmetsp:Transcript_20432/g.44537  ORF Transcript_20432/g.44537 Transcript_20432/m.44537 type:complete len:246 (+) Transcript_20432:205-942(+)